MLILALDTSSRTSSVALVRDQIVLGEVISRSDEPYSVRLFQDLEALLSDLDISLDQIDLFGVAAGPGSFTGLRTGLAAVKAWAELFSKPIAPVSALKAVAYQALWILSTNSAALTAPFIDARRGQLFGGLYRRGKDMLSFLDQVEEDAVLDAHEFIDRVAERAGTLVPGSDRSLSVIFVSPMPDLLRPVLEESILKGSRIESASGVLAGVIGQLGYGQALRGEVVDALTLDANYIRRSDAERNWKKKTETRIVP